MAVGDHDVYPVLASGPDPATGSTAWTWGSWVELVPVNTITTPFAIEGLTALAPRAGGAAATRNSATNRAEMHHNDDGIPDSDSEFSGQGRPCR